jgi:hypothetical protein
MTIATWTYHCDGDIGRIREDEGSLLELAAAAPVLGESHPVRVSGSKLIAVVWIYRAVSRHTIRHHFIQMQSVNECYPLREERFTCHPARGP